MYNCISLSKMIDIYVQQFLSSKSQKKIARIKPMLLLGWFSDIPNIGNEAGDEVIIKDNTKIYIKTYAGEPVDDEAPNEDIGGMEYYANDEELIEDSG